jgi:hypothetical protein
MTDDLVSPDALNELIGGIEEKTRETDPSLHVVFFDPTGRMVDSEKEAEFADRERMEEWTDARSDTDTVVVVERVGDPPPEPDS